MNLRSVIYVIFAALFFGACQVIPDRLDEDRVVASVGERVLRLREVSSALPDGLKGGDSLDFVDQYVERWVARQVKVREAERIFSSSVSDIESMVAAYRQALLMRKLDQYYISTSTEEPFTARNVAEYYAHNMSSFKLSDPIVKGNILRIPNDDSSLKTLTTMMKSNSEESRLNLVSMCDKSDKLSFKEQNTWLKYDDFLSMLPIVKGASSGVYMKRDGVQTVKDGSYTYLFEITAYRSAGYVAPLEIVDEQIRRILTSKHHKDLIREREEGLYRRAEIANIIKKNVYRATEERAKTDVAYPALIDKN